MGAFEILDHTADVGVRADGADLGEAFANAARGMFSIITDLGTIRVSESYRVSVTAPDAEALLVNWLNELLYWFEVDGFLFGKLTIEEITQRQLVATCTGERFDPERHPMKTGVKAATYHGLEIKQDHPIYVRVILDI